MSIRTWLTFALPLAFNALFVSGGILFVLLLDGSFERAELFLPVIVLASFGLSPILTSLCVQRRDLFDHGTDRSSKDWDGSLGR